jgi:predicted porin
VGYARNGSNSNFSLEASPRDAANNTSPLAGESQTGAYVGMLHQF